MKFVRPLDQNIRSDIKQKHKLWNKCKKNKDPDAWKEYKKARNKVRNMTRQRDRKEQLEICKGSKKNPKKFWNFINSKSKYSNTIPDLEWYDDDNKVTAADSDIDKAELLNNYFSSVFNKRQIHSNIECEIKDIKDPMCEIDFTEEEIVKKHY